MTRTNYAKRGYLADIGDIPWQAQLRIFCLRRSGDVFHGLSHILSFDDILARVYLQGVIDGRDAAQRTQGGE